MHDTIILKTGRTIPFYSSLGFHGIYVEVDNSLFDTAEDKKNFESEIKQERDVVRITYIKK